jgi:hypothetical protein
LKLKSNLQCGSVLVLTLLILLFLQFVAIAVVNSTNVSSMVVRNYQTSSELSLASHKIINFILTHKDYFVDYSAYLNSDGEFEIPLDTLLSPQINAKIISFKCLDIGISESPLDCSLNNKYWQLVVQVENYKSKASLGFVQGIHLSLTPSITADHSPDKTQEILLQAAWWFEM